MANFSSLKRNPTAFKEGAWKHPDPDMDLEIQTRGLTDAYYDRQAAKHRKAAKSFGGDVDKLPLAMKRRLNIECLIAECLLDVKMKDDDGKDVTFEEFCEAILDPDCVDLANAAFTAATMVSNERNADAKELVGN